MFVDRTYIFQMPVSVVGFVGSEAETEVRVHNVEFEVGVAKVVVVADLDVTFSVPCTYQELGQGGG